MRGGAANPKGITRHDQGVRARCRIGRAGDGLDGPPFIDTYDLRRVGPGERVTTYETGLRISAKARRAIHGVTIKRYDRTNATDYDVKRSAMVESSSKQRISTELRKAVTLTAIITFVCTTLAAYIIGRALDAVQSGISSDIEIDSGAQHGPDLNVMVPPLTELSSVAFPNDSELVTRWAVNVGGAPADYTEIILTIWGTKPRPLILSGLRASNVDCRPAPKFVHIPAFGGGDIGERLMRIDLDSGSTDAQPAENQLTGELFKFPLQVSQAEVERFRVSVTSRSSDCRFRLQVGYEHRGGIKWIDTSRTTYRVIASTNSVETYRWAPRSDGDETLVLQED